MKNLTSPIAPVLERAIGASGFVPHKPGAAELPALARPLARRAFAFDEPIAKGRVVTDYVDVIKPTSKRAAKAQGHKNRILRVRNWQVRNSSIQ